MPSSSSLYGYVPGLEGNVIFLLASAVSFAVTLAITIRTQRHVAFGSLMSLACVLEVLGYSGRVYAHSAPDMLFPYVQSTVFLIVSPVFLTSSLYTTFGDIVRVLGDEHSLITSQMYTRILIPFDTAGLLLQIVGCAVAFSKIDSKDGTGPNLAKGFYIVIAGLALQVVALVAGLALLMAVLMNAGTAVRRHGYTTFHKDVGFVPLARRTKVLVAVVPVAGTALLVRLLCRTAELSQGRLWRNEMLFFGLESLMVAIALVLLAGCHPAVFLRDGEKRMSALRGENAAGGRSVGDLEAVSEVARGLEGSLARRWSMRSWRPKYVIGGRERPVEGLRTAMCTRHGDLNDVLGKLEIN